MSPNSSIVSGLGDLDLDKVAVAFKTHVIAKDRRYRLKTYKKCFIACQGVDFLVESGLAASREEAVELGKALQVEKSLFRHVTGDHMFKDEYLFFSYIPVQRTQLMLHQTNGHATTDSSTPEQRPPQVLNLLGVKEAVERGGEDDEEDSDDVMGGAMSFANQNKRRDWDKGSDGKEIAPGLRKSMVLAAAEKAIKELQMAERINEQLIQNAGSINAPFETEIKPTDMRCLALVAHNHMKPAMKQFITGHSEILKKFRLTGTNTTMTMCRTVFGDDNENVLYGPTCTSGPLGGDAQLAALLCLEDVGAIIFFMDPLSPHPHQADIDSLVRLANVHNVILCPNPTTAVAMMWMMRQSLAQNEPEMFPSFFQTLESPAVADYKAGQKKALESAIKS